MNEVHTNLKLNDLALDHLEHAVMLQINEQLYAEGCISSGQYEHAKGKIIDFDT